MVIIIALLILQSLILAIYHGASQEYYHFYLFLDLLLLLTKFTNKLTTLLLILSVCLHFEIFNPQQLVSIILLKHRIQHISLLCVWQSVLSSSKRRREQYLSPSHSSTYLSDSPSTINQPSTLPLLPSQPSPSIVLKQW